MLCNFGSIFGTNCHDIGHYTFLRYSANIARQYRAGIDDIGNNTRPNKSYTISNSFSFSGPCSYIDAWGIDASLFLGNNRLKFLRPLGYIYMIFWGWEWDNGSKVYGKEKRSHTSNIRLIMTVIYRSTSTVEHSDPFSGHPVYFITWQS